MLLALRKSLRSGLCERWATRLALGISVLSLSVATSAQSALAAGAPFQRGDVLTSVGGGRVNFYTPDGTLKDTFASGFRGEQSLLRPERHPLDRPRCGAL